MNITYKVSDKCTVSAEIQQGQDMKRLFAAIAGAQEILTIDKCGNCGSPNVKLRYRTPKGYQYYDYKCQDCHYELKISEQKPENGGRLYANREWQPPYQGDGESQAAPSPEPVYQYGPESTPAPPMQQAPSTPQPAAADGIPW